MAHHLGQKNKQGKLERKEDNGFISKKIKKWLNFKEKKDPGSPLGFAC